MSTVNDLTTILRDRPYQLWIHHHDQGIRLLKRHILTLPKRPSVQPFLTRGCVYTEKESCYEYSFHYPEHTQIILRTTFPICEWQEEEFAENLLQLTLYYVEQQQQLRLTSLSESIHAVSAMTPLDQLLETLLDTTMKVIAEGFCMVLPYPHICLNSR